ncbi:hypothetical protein NDU88_007806 [Pleurodeles waltl]|uniref:Uncharacterized protein n=1 Tax=Pleurodeles waltl TaxID=8319 RepID=A0AAV7PMQ5_PLEWA|nr:hypothetical protein NDU88_007806 [Pleurodeles waltl]
MGCQGTSTPEKARPGYRNSDAKGKMHDFAQFMCRADKEAKFCNVSAIPSERVTICTPEHKHIAALSAPERRRAHQCGPHYEAIGAAGAQGSHPDRSNALRSSSSPQAHTVPPSNPDLSGITPGRDLRPRAKAPAQVHHHCSPPQDHSPVQPSPQLIHTNRPWPCSLAGGASPLSQHPILHTSHGRPQGLLIVVPAIRCVTAPDVVADK